MTINWPHSRAKFARDHHLEVLLSLLILLPSKMRKHFELDPKRVVLHGFQMPCRGEVMLTCSCYPTSRFVSQRCHETKISQRNATNTEFIWFIWSVCKTKTTRWKSSSDSICRSIASRWIVYKRVTICGIRVNREEFGLDQFRPEGTPIGICICLQGQNTQGSRRASECNPWCSSWLFATSDQQASLFGSRIAAWQDSTITTSNRSKLAIRLGFLLHILQPVSVSCSEI